MYARYFRTRTARNLQLRPDWIRQLHRWVAMLFTLTVAANFAAMALVPVPVPVPAFITYAPLPPLFLMMVSGLYMFIRPYVAVWRHSEGGTA